VEPLKLGIAGCGFVTESRHLPTLEGLPEIRVVALADVDLAKCERLASRFGQPSSHPDVDALLADSDVEAVAVCTPASTHAEVALPALDAGKHVLLEKPIALSLADADALVEWAQKLPVTTTVAFNQRYHPLVREARERLREGALGAVTAVATRMTGARLAQPDLPAWRRRRDLGGGGLLEKLVHHFDLWRFLLDDEVEDVFADSRCERADDDTTLVTARMRRGTLVHAFGSDLSPLSNEVLVYGEKGSVHVDLYRLDGLVFSGVGEMPSLGEQGSGALWDESYTAQWRSFAAAARGSGRPASTFEDGRRALQIALAAAQSASLRRRIKVADVPVIAPPIRVEPV
jgi:predicted dehydrogenase